MLGNIISDCCFDFFLNISISILLNHLHTRGGAWEWRTAELRFAIRAVYLGGSRLEHCNIRPRMVSGEHSVTRAAMSSGSDAPWKGQQWSNPCRLSFPFPPDDIYSVVTKVQFTLHWSKGSAVLCVAWTSEVIISSNCISEMRTGTKSKMEQTHFQ